MSKKAHNWVVKTGDAGAIGLYDYWECLDCGASGGAWDTTKPPKRAFVAGYGLEASCPMDDCNESKAIVESYNNNEDTTMKKNNISQFTNEDLSNIRCKICDVLNISYNETNGWPRNRELVVQVKHYSSYRNSLEIRICDTPLTFEILEKVATAVGTKKINIDSTPWQGGSDETPCSGSDIVLTVYYDD